MVEGVTGNIIAAVAVFLFAEVWRRWLLPFFENFFYKGIKIKGTWTLTDSPDYIETEILVLKQTASTLRGTLTLTPKPGQPGHQKMLQVTGTILDGFVAIACTSREQSFQTFLGQVLGGGTQLIGNATYFDTGKNEITTDKVSYHK